MGRSTAKSAMLRLTLFLFTSTILAAAPANSQSEFWENLLDITPPQLEALSGITFTGIAVRPERDLWFAGLTKIYRFDGDLVQSFGLPGVTDSGLPIARIASLFTDGLGKIWAVDFQGRIFNFSSEYKGFRLVSELPDKISGLSSVEFHRSSGLWAGYSDGHCLAYSLESQTIIDWCEGLDVSIEDFAFLGHTTFALSRDGEVLEITLEEDGSAVTRKHQCSVKDVKFLEILALDSSDFLLGSAGAGLYQCSLAGPTPITTRFLLGGSETIE